MATMGIYEEQPPTYYRRDRGCYRTGNQAVQAVEDEFFKVVTKVRRKVNNGAPLKVVIGQIVAAAEKFEADVAKAEKALIKKEIEQLEKKIAELKKKLGEDVKAKAEELEYDGRYGYRPKN